ncbi:TonB-dependent receptor domain-containing protein [Rhodovibrio salinarum]|uniref:Secretin/TonB short N-terminal domain-containing protein n=1 Tax=Rhodovibrio salinarum TaxID=1087 RepID=A0A934V1V2_9PROT|nr:TonB-dependent receptor [Rhodovibrio salinarum]MBK1699028.1 hypothetical protein [Rhodovibrio salinarum]
MTEWGAAHSEGAAAVSREDNPAPRQRLAAALAVTALISTLAVPAWAQESGQEPSQQVQQTYAFDIGPQSLASALNAFSDVTGWQVGYRSEVADGATTDGVSGQYTAASALRQLLAGSGLSYSKTGAQTVTLERIAPAEASIGGEELGPVVVSATRTDTPASKLTRSVTVVDQEEISKQKRTGRNLGDILSKTVPGFSQSTEALTNYGQTIRGRKFLTMIDGVPQTMSLRDSGRALNTIDADAIERVEVVRGGTAAYGFGATGGLVNVITRRPEDGAINGHSEGGFKLSTTHPDESLEWHTNHRVSGRTGKIDYLFSGTFVQRNSRFDADGDRIPAYGFGAQGGLADTDEYDMLGKLGYEFDGGDQRLEVTVNHYDIEQDTNWAGIGTGVPSEDIKTPAVRGDQGGENMFTESTVGSLSYRNRDVFGSEVKSKVYYSDLATQLAKWPGYPQDSYSSEKLGGRLTVDTPVDFDALPFNLVWGTDYLHDKTVSNRVDGSVITPDQEQNAYAGFVQAEVPVGEIAMLRGGVRHEYITLDVGDVTNYYGVDVDGGELTFNETLFNASAVVFVTDRVELFGGYSQGFSLADMGAAIAYTSQTDAENLESEAQKVDNYEIGLRGNYGRWDGSITGFYSQSDKGTTYSYTDLSIAKEPERIYGLELSGNLQVTQQVRVGSTFTWMEGEVDIDGDDDYEEDLPSTRVPPIKLTSYVEYDPTDWASLRLQGLYSGHRNPDSSQYGGGDVDSYVLFDLFASFDTGYGTLELGIQNLLNEDYFPVLHQAAANPDYFNAGQGRTASITYSVKW